MSETLKRTISGIVYMTIMWIGTAWNESSFRLLFITLTIVSIYEMWRLRKGKSKILAFAYVLVPFILVQLILTTKTLANWNSNLILFMFILTWTFDTFAYLIGIKFGKHKIMPSISPKKSWQGFAGGFIFTIIAAYITSEYFLKIHLQLVITLSLLLPFTATLGDFIASHYKREAGVKDSGNLIPGHGGILDRMDAFMITIPTIYILTKLL